MLGVVPFLCGGGTEMQGMAHVHVAGMPSLSLFLTLWETERCVKSHTVLCNWVEVHGSPPLASVFHAELSGNLSHLFRSFQLAEHLQNIFLPSPRWAEHLISGKDFFVASIRFICQLLGFQEGASELSIWSLPNSKSTRWKMEKTILFLCPHGKTILLLWKHPYYMILTFLFKKFATFLATSTSFLKYVLNWIEIHGRGHPPQRDLSFAFPFIVPTVSCLHMTSDKGWFFHNVQ